jgi:glycerophosphoryl diester phosphodiesterase
MIKYRKIIFTIIICIFYVLIYTNYSNASNQRLKAFNNAPRMNINVNNEKYDNIEIKFTDYNGLNSSNIKFFSVNSENERTEIKDKDFILSEKVSVVKNEKDVQYTYVISNKYLGQKTKRFYVSAMDNTGKILESYFKIESNGKRYRAKYASKVGNWDISNNGVSCKVEASDGIEEVILYDMNNYGEETYKEQKIQGNIATINFDIKQFKEINNRYQIKIFTKDQSKEGQEASRLVTFGISDTINQNDSVNNLSTKSDEKNNKNKKINVLFVGNSKTYVKDIPKKFKGLAKAGGYNKVSVTAVTQGGKTLKYLASKYSKKISKEKYDYVIIQEGSDNYPNYNEFLEGAKQISNLVRNKNKDAKIYLRQVWLLKNSSNEEKKQVYENAEKVAKNINAKLIYDGKSFDKCNSQYPSINLYSDDRHQTLSGAYLAACSIYESIFNESSVGLSYKAGLSADNVIKLQQIAHDIYNTERITKTNVGKTNNSNEKEQKEFVITAHRGANRGKGYAPENTKAAFDLAIEMGATELECDIRKTKDGELVICHDDTINRTSNGKGKVSEMTYKQLLKYDFGNGQKIMSLKDFAKRYFSKDISVALEIKDSGIEAQMMKIINKYKKKDNILVMNFSYNSLKKIREIDSKVQIGWLLHEDELIDTNRIKKLQEINGTELRVKKTKLTKEQINLAHKQNIKINVWGVSDSQLQEVYNLGVDGITTNHPDKLIKIVK